MSNVINKWMNGGRWRKISLHERGVSLPTDVPTRQSYISVCTNVPLWCHPLSIIKWDKCEREAISLKGQQPHQCGAALWLGLCFCGTNIFCYISARAAPQIMRILKTGMEEEEHLYLLLPWLWSPFHLQYLNKVKLTQTWRCKLWDGHCKPTCSYTTKYHK